MSACNTELLVTVPVEPALDVTVTGDDKLGTLCAVVKAFDTVNQECHMVNYYME